MVTVSQFQFDPDAPIVRFSFDNGWTASMLMRAPLRNDAGFMFCGLAAWPTDFPDSNLRVLGESEASANEAVGFLAEIAAREPFDS